MVRKTIRGRVYEVSRNDIIMAAKMVSPEEIRHWYVEIEGLQYPPKQIVAEALGLRRLDFTTSDAKRLLENLGFKLERI